MKIPVDFYIQDDVVTIARELLGKVIFTKFNGAITSGIITETEAYAGVSDMASHAFGGRRTRRTETMFKQGGIAYVYLCYGIHHLFNFVTGKKDIPHAVLLRGIFPMTGIDVMEKRKGKRFAKNNFSDGPGKLTRALGIETKHDRISLFGDTIWVEDTGIRIGENNIHCGPRIGVDYAGEDALLPYRFLIKELQRIKKTPLDSREV